jgi:hypothetical protein
MDEATRTYLQERRSLTGRFVPKRDIATGLLGAVFGAMAPDDPTLSQHLQSILVGAVGSVLIVEAFIFAWRFVWVVPKEMDSRARRHIADQNRELDSLRAKLKSKTHCLDKKDPAFYNMLRVIAAFEGLRGEPPETRCQIWITAPDETTDLAHTVAVLASAGSRCVVTALDNKIDPDNENMALDGMEPNTLVLHMARDFPRQDEIFTALSNVFRMKRSYELRPDWKPHFIWLQFGTGLQWNTEQGA